MDLIEAARYRGILDREELAHNRVIQPEPKAGFPHPKGVWGYITACSQNGLCLIKRVAGPLSSPALGVVDEWAWIGFEPWNKKGDHVPLMPLPAFRVGEILVRWTVIHLYNGLGRYSVPAKQYIIPDDGPPVADYCLDD